LFAAHPLHAEAGGMIYGLLELLSAIFVFCAIRLWLSAEETPARAAWPKWIAALAVAFCAYRSRLCRWLHCS
jgi:hypothetical protein